MRNYKAVVIDDEYFIRTGFKFLLDWEKLRMEIAGQASDGEQGLELVKELCPDVVFLDIKMPKMDDKHKNRLQKVVRIAIILIIAIFTCTYTIQSIEPILNTICKSEAKAIATKISNVRATEVMSNYSYSDIVKIARDNDQNIKSVELDIIKVNEIVSDVALKIQEDLDDIGSQELGIAMGTFTGSKLLSGRGPKIYYRIISIGDVETDYRSEFKQAGINQTQHRVYLQVDCNVAILTPFNTIEEKISNQVVLAENVIVGNIPSTYYNFNGIENNDQILETVN